MTQFLTIFRRFPTTFRRFPKIFQNCFEVLTNVSEHFPNISRTFPNIFPKIAEGDRRCFDHTPTNFSVVEGTSEKCCQTWFLHYPIFYKLDSLPLLRTFARKFSNIDFFLRLLPLKVDDLLMSEMWKKWGSPTSFRREQAWKISLNLKNRASLANKTTMSVSQKTIQLNLWSEMFSAKYCSSRPTKWN